MNFFRKLYMDDRGLETNKFLKGVAIFLLLSAIIIFIAAILSFIFLMYMDMISTAEIVILIGLVSSVYIFIYAANLLASTVIGNNISHMRLLYKKNTARKKRDVSFETEL